MFTVNSKREFVPPDQVSPLLVLTVQYSYTKIGRFTPIVADLSIRIVLTVLSCFAVNAMLNPALVRGPGESCWIIDIELSQLQAIHIGFKSRRG